MKKQIPLRNGDFTFKPFVGKVTGEKIKVGKEFNFSHSAVTGNSHTLVCEEMTVYKKKDGEFIVKLSVDGKATHPEHSTKNDLVIPKGTYHVCQGRERDWFSLSTRKIID